MVAGTKRVFIAMGQKKNFNGSLLVRFLTKKYAATDKPHTRMSELVVRPGLLKNVSIVTSSHNHTDHLDAGNPVPGFK
jgi:L-ascorbate metabolism protein UlaG (beta-lactamase superfamily)